MGRGEGVGWKGERIGNRMLETRIRINAIPKRRKKKKKKKRVSRWVKRGKGMR